MEEVITMSSTNTCPRKTCKQCLKYVNLYLTCFKCDAIYHIYCRKKVPGAYVNEKGHFLCCDDLTSKYASTGKNWGSQDNPLERVIEKGNVDGYNEDLEDYFVKKENFEWNELKWDARSSEFTNKKQMKNHCSESPNKQGGSIRGLNKDKAGLICSFPNEVHFQKESYEQPIKPCDVQSSYSQLNKDNDICITSNYSTNDEWLFKCDMSDYMVEESETPPDEAFGRQPQIHGSEMPFKCDLCGYAAAQKSALNVHIKFKHSNAEKEYKCKDCQYSSSRKQNLVSHIRTHTNEKPFKCDRCDYAAALSHTLKKHVLIKHSNLEKMYKCSDCEYSNYTKVGLLKHMHNHTNERPFRCDICDFAPAHKNSLYSHMLTKHSNLEKSQKCAHCEYSTHAKSMLIRHERIHIHEKPHKCDMCNYATIDEKTLKLHIFRRHSNVEQKHKCTDCKFSTHEKRRLVEHRRVHTKEKPFKCDNCGYAAAQKNNLKAHILRKHSNAEKEYRCEDCTYSTYIKEYLRAHVRGHTNERSFRYDKCDYAATRGASLNARISAEKDVSGDIANIPLKEESL